MKTILLTSFALLLTCMSAGADDDLNYQGDVTDVRVIRRMEQYPYAGKVWQPFIIQGDGKRDLLVALGVQLNGKGDMGDIMGRRSFRNQPSPASFCTKGILLRAMWPVN